MPEKDKKLLQRYCHGATAVADTSDCTEVIMYGGCSKNGSLIGNTVVVSFSKYFGHCLIPLLVVGVVCQCTYN